MSRPPFQNKSEFLEEFSLKIEEFGHPRIYGQIIGWLLICEPAYQSFPDLMENLGISKASISNTTRMLLERGLIEKVRRPGERQIYFKLKEGSLVEFMEKQLQLTLDLESITSRGLELVKEMKDTDPNRLQKANDFHQFMAKQSKNILQKYKEENNL